MGETALWHPGQVAEPPKRGWGMEKEVAVGGAVGGGRSYRLEEE